jgi:hypothetical protein
MLTPLVATLPKNRGGWGVLLLTRFPIRKSVLRSSATKDLSSQPTKAVCLERPSGGRDLSSGPTKVSILRSIATIEDPDPVGKDLSCYPAGKVLPSRQFRPQGS